MVEIKQRQIEAADLIKFDALDSMRNNHQHGSSLGKLLPASPSKRLSKARLEGSTSNPSMTIAQRNSRKSKQKLLEGKASPLH